MVACGAVGAGAARGAATKAVKSAPAVKGCWYQGLAVAWMVGRGSPTLIFAEPVFWQSVPQLELTSL